MRTGLIGFGLVELAVGVAPAVAAGARPGSRSGAARTERATFDLPLGLALLTAVQRHSWRAPLLAVGTMSWTLRAAGQMRGTRRTAPGHGRLLRSGESILGAGMLGWLFARAARAERWSTS